MIKTIVFRARKPNVSRIYLGYESDNLVERLEFVLPGIHAQQTAMLMFGGQYANMVILARENNHYGVDLTAELVGAPGEIEAFVTINTPEGKVWNSDPFTMVTGGLPNVDTEIQEHFPDAIEQMRQEMAEHRAEMERLTAIKELIDYVGSELPGILEAESLREDAEDKRENAETERIEAEDLRDAAETDRINAEAERAREEKSRAAAEGVRAQNESQRIDTEDARAAAETSRANAETARVAAESARESDAEKRQNEWDEMSEEVTDAVAAANKVQEIAMEVEMLVPSAEATAAVEQTEKKTTFLLGIPMSKLAYATFEVDENMNLLMHAPEGYDNINFALNNGNLEVMIV